MLYFAMREKAFEADGPMGGASAAAREAASATWERFLHGSDEYRQARWKVIPGIPEGAWVVQNAFGNTPTLLANKLTHTWHVSTAPAIPAAPGPADGSAHFTGAAVEGSGQGGSSVEEGQRDTSPRYGAYVESDCDVASSTMARMLVDLLLANARDVVINLGFLVQAQEEDELPEQLLGAAQISRVHYERMPVADVGNVDRVEAVQEADTPTPEGDASWGGWFSGLVGSPAPDAAKPSPTPSSP